MEPTPYDTSLEARRALYLRTIDEDARRRIDAFFDCHLLCGHPRWPEGRKPKLEELPHLEWTADIYNEFIDVVVTCVLCRASESCIATEPDEWLRLSHSAVQG